MYSEKENLFIPEGFDAHPVTSASFDFIQTIKLLEHAEVVLVAEEGQLPLVAFEREEQ
jgi:hypothetical protein